ncbi:MAG: hypothetical protein U5N56_07895 [Candidatus Marinimicrobia bacterium]|nr:hypothetical protein [Candidatus Neomarinimicrobiota bacterium]
MILFTGEFKNLNNLMGFTVGIKESLKSIRNTSIEEFKDSLLNFEEAFKNFDVSKIKLSRERRKLTYHLFANYNKFETADSDELLLSFNELD